MFVAHDRKNTRMEQDPVPVRATREKKKTIRPPTYIKVAPLPAAAWQLYTTEYSVTQSAPVQKSMPSVRPSTAKQVGALPELASRSREP